MPYDLGDEFWYGFCPHADEKLPRIKPTECRRCLDKLIKDVSKEAVERFRKGP